MEPVITLRDVSKEFKVVKGREGLKGSIQNLFAREYNIIKAVNHVSMEIEQGEIVGYLGPNGAGKSTTIKMMSGVLIPSSGEIRVNGLIPYQSRMENAQHIGVVFGQRSQLWWSLPLIESFKLLRDIYQIDQKDYEDTLAFYEFIVDIKSLYSKPVRQMSLGQRTLSDILAAFLHNPPVVYLDEPTIGLDVSMKSKIRELIKALNQKKNTTVILTTHDMGDVDALCRRIVIIDKGTMLYDNSIENLRSFFGAYRTMKLRFTKNASELTKEYLETQAAEIVQDLSTKYPNVASIAVSVEDDWIDVLLNEDEIPLMKVMNHIQEQRRIYDVQLQEISTESVIKKIYEGKM